MRNFQTDNAQSRHSSLSSKITHHGTQTDYSSQAHIDTKIKALL